jgi:hypothetical protein
MNSHTQHMLTQAEGPCIHPQETQSCTNLQLLCINSHLQCMCTHAEECLYAHPPLLCTCTRAGGACMCKLTPTVRAHTCRVRVHTRNTCMHKPTHTVHAYTCKRPTHTHTQKTQPSTDLRPLCTNPHLHDLLAYIYSSTYMHMSHSNALKRRGIYMSYICTYFIFPPYLLIRLLVASTIGKLGQSFPKEAFVPSRLHSWDKK